MSRVRSWLAAPHGARLLGVALAVAGVALLLLGLVVINSGDGGVPGAAPDPSRSASGPAPSGTGGPSPSPVPTGTPTGTPTTGSPAPTSGPPATSAPPPASPPAQPSGSPGSTGAPAPVRAPLTVLNNSTLPGLGDRAAADVRAKGWTVASVGNFGGRIPVTTVYFTPGNAAEERAARQLATELPQVARVYPRYEGLPPTPTGVVLVVTRDW